MAQLDVRLGRGGGRGRGRGKGRGLGAGETGAPGVPKARGGTGGRWALSFTGLFSEREAGAADTRARGDAGTRVLASHGGPRGWCQGLGRDKCGGGAGDRWCLGPSVQRSTLPVQQLVPNAGPDGAGLSCAPVQHPGPGPDPQPWHCP